MLKKMVTGQMNTLLVQPLHKPETYAIAGNYQALMMQRLSKAEVITLNTSRYFSYPHHLLTEKDRMLNQELDFPIAFIFGDRDFFGSEGAD